MKVTHALINMKDTSYNSLGGTIIPCNNKQRIGFKLESGKKISVRPECLLMLDEKDLCICGSCCVCFEEIRGYQCKAMPCKHILCGTCWKKMDHDYKATLEARLASNTFVTDDMFNNLSARCPVCQVLVTPLTSMWYEQPVALIMLQNIGCICQLYHRIKRLPEPSLAEEAIWIDRCEKLAEEQLTKSGLERLINSFECRRRLFMRNPVVPSQQYTTLQDHFVQLLVLHVVHSCFDEDAINKAVRILFVEGSGVRI